MNKTARYIAPLTIASGLLLSACSTDATDTATATSTDAAATTAGTCATDAASPDAASADAGLGAVDVTGAEAPTVTFDAPLAIAEETAEVAHLGDGDDVATGDLITFNYLICDTVTGEKVHSTWELDAEENTPETYVLSASNFGDALTGALDGATVGTQVLWAQPGISAEESSTGTEVDGYLYALTVTDAQTIPDAASGTDVPPTDASLPAIAIEDGKPTVSVPSAFAEPEELVVQPLIDGDGAEVEEGQTVAVKYTGWLTDGTQFDSSWDQDSPDDVFTFQVGVGSVIAGWDEALVGQRVGSRLLLVVPADLAYGEDGGGESIPADSTLIFAVDILAAV